MLAGELQQKQLLDKTQKKLEQQEYQVSKLEQWLNEKKTIISKHEDKIEEMEGTNRYLIEEIHVKERETKNATMLYESLKQ